MVISNPKRMSLALGVVHFIVVSFDQTYCCMYEDYTTKSTKSYPEKYDFVLVKLTKCLRYQLVFFLATTTFWTDVVLVQVFEHAVHGFVMNMTTHCAHVLLHGGLLIVPLCERLGLW